MIQGLITKLQDQKTTKALEYMIFGFTSLLAIMMITEPFAICGAEETVVTAYQMIEYQPQAIMLAAGPFLIGIVYAEHAPSHWKAVKLCVIGVFFTISLMITMRYGIPVLEEEFGSTEKQLIILPVMFYCNLAIGIMSLLTGSKE